MPLAKTIKEKTLAVKRQHVLQAALKVFSEKGFRKATIRDVATEAGVADGTIYNIFENKAALLRGILESHPGEMPIPDIAKEDAASFLKQMIEARWNTMTPESLAMLRVILSEALIDRDFRNLYREMMLVPALSGLDHLLSALTGNTDNEINSRLLTATFIGLVMLRLLGDDADGRISDKIPDQMTDLFLHGLKGQVR